MAVDRKSDHYTSAEGYSDLDGLSRQFTFVDHDKKLQINIPTDSEPFDWKEYRNDLLVRITSISASQCPIPFRGFTVNGEYGEWNTDMLMDEGVATTRLRDLAVLLENARELGSSDEDFPQIIT